MLMVVEHLPPLAYQLIYSGHTYTAGRYRELQYIRLILDATFMYRSDIQYELHSIKPYVNDRRMLVGTQMIKYCERECNKKLI